MLFRSHGIDACARGPNGYLLRETGQQSHFFIHYGIVHSAAVHDFFNIDILEHLLPLLFVIFLGTLGFCALGTLLSSLASNLKSRDIMLPILLYPLLVPIVIAVVRMTGQILNGEPLSGMMNWIGLTASFDIIYIGVSIMTVDHILEE